MKRIALLLCALFLAGCGSTSTTTAPTTTSQAVNTSVVYSTTAIGDIKSPVDLVERVLSDSWFYVVSQEGTIQQWSRDGRTKRTVLDVSSFTTFGGERGLLGLAFRNVDNEWQAILNRTNRDGHTEITITTVNDDGSFASPTSPGKVVLVIEQPYQNHNGGAVLVGPDNMVYIGMGDGGSADDPDRIAQDMSSLLGKILRINPSVAGGYSVPNGNPFISSPHPEIWSLGVRNPWRMTFDPHGTLWVADVGQNEWEEVTALPSDKNYPGGRGANLGWSAFEGSHAFNSDVTITNPVVPLFEYDHSKDRCSISGAAVGNNTTTPGRAGWFFFGDYCAGTVSAILTDGSTTIGEEEVASNLGNVVAVRATHKAMYILSADGKVREVVVTRS
ncbi:MAG: PQQ-dependent sugar dehydrogenase [Actinobacteria bacterium]|nr:PQQ-dependent sugar dehydrogenase [Actinomycetota bacterium]